jgi:hypothetical protein
MMLRLVAIFVATLFIVVCHVPGAVDGAPPSSNSDDDGEARLTGPNGLLAYVTKKGAKIRVYRNVSYAGGANNTNQNGTGNGEERSSWGETKPVTVYIDEIEEVDAELNKLRPTNKVTSFANVDFAVTLEKNVSMPLVANASAVFADCLNCSGTLNRPTKKAGAGGGARISLAVCAITTNGTLDLNGELTDVTAGQLKITLTVSDWTWQAPTNKLTVDVALKVAKGRKVKKDSTTGGGKPSKFSLGADSFMEFSRMVYEDNAWYTMPDEYPKFTSQGVNNVFTLVFDHFNDTVVYDPNIEAGYEANDDNSTTTKPPATEEPTSSSRRCLSSAISLSTAMFLIVFVLESVV